MAARQTLQQKLILLALLRLKRRRKKITKRFWIRKLFLERTKKGEYEMLVKDLMLFDHEYFFRSFRMDPTKFEQLLSWVAPHIYKSSKIREVTSPAERLCITLRYLATGDAQTTIGTSYRVSPPVVGRIIREVCEVLWRELLQRGYLKVPSTEKNWREIAAVFERKWNFPHCIGAIDGKHVVIQAPPRSGSDYFNYKKTHSIVLMAVCNGDYEFTLVDVGDAGRQSDGGVYKCSNLGYAIDNNLLNTPQPEPFHNSSGTDKCYPYVFVADEAFQLQTYMVKPYARFGNDEAREIFNYRLSRARRIIENTFGIATARFRVFRRPIIAHVEAAILFTKAVVALHNFLMKSQKMNDTHPYCPLGFTDQEDSRGRRSGSWRNETHGFSGLVGTGTIGSNNYSRSAKIVREDFKEYFNSQDGAVSWQWDTVNSTTNPFDEEY